MNSHLVLSSFLLLCLCGNGLFIYTRMSPRALHRVETFFFVGLKIILVSHVIYFYYFGFLYFI